MSKLNALAQALSGDHGDTLLEVINVICPTVHDRSSRLAQLARLGAPRSSIATGAHPTGAG